MHMTPTMITGLALFAFALVLVPDKYKPKWICRLTWWQVLIGFIATVAALLVVMNPEFLALGILGDSTFFDLLALAIGVQLQVVFSRIGVSVLVGGARVVRFINWRFCSICMMLTLAVSDIASTVDAI